MQIIQPITLDVNNRTPLVCLCAKQGDRGSRFVEVTLLKDGESYPFAGEEAVFRCGKPDGTACMNPAVIRENGTVLVELTEQVLAVAGDVLADISLVGENGEILSSASFAIHVEVAPKGAAVESSNEFLTLLALADRLEELAQRCEGALEALENG